MNIENICSPYTNIEVLTATLNAGHPDFKRGVFDMCAAFNYKADVAPNAAPGREDVMLLTESGWPAGRLVYARDHSSGETQYYFKFISRKIKKAKSDARSDRNSRAANKIKDLIKVLRMKKEVITDANAFETEERAVRYAYDSVRGQVEDRAAPKIVLPIELADEVARAALGKSVLSEAYRSGVEALYDKFRQECEALEESRSSLKMFNQGCYAVGLIDHWDKINYVVTKVTINRASGGTPKIEFQGPVKRYTTLVGTELETDAAIIRTYMQSRPGHDARNEFYVCRSDKYYPEVEVATGYAGEGAAGMWVLLPDRA